ncbi:MAG: DUF1573 domain-containing protein [bacterium]|nr:DUF1573 domain-containing protein [bacterium]
MKIAASAVFAIWVSVTLAINAFAAPYLGVEAEHNFGQIFQGQKIQHTFVFGNYGDAPLVITGIKTSCQCTAALLSAPEIPPDATGEIQLTFNSHDFSGKVTKHVLFTTNDPRHTQVKLTLRGLVQPEIEATPPLIRPQYLPMGQTTLARVTLANRGKTPIELGEPHSTIDEVTATLFARKLAPGEQTTLVVNITPRSNQPHVRGLVLIDLKGAHIEELRIPVYTRVLPNSSSNAPEPNFSKDR